MLLSAMARAVKIDVRPVLISTWHNGRADTLLPSALQFNHLIGYAPDVAPGGIWLDATDKAGTFGALPWYDQGMPVIVAGTADKGFRAFTPRVAASANATAVDWTVELNADGSALVKGATMFTGASALELRNDLRVADTSDVRQWLGTSLARRCPGATLVSYTPPSVRPPRDTLVVSYTFRAPSFGVRRESLLVIRPWAFNASPLADYFREQQRTYPVRFEYPSESSLRLTIWTPLGWRHQTQSSADSLPAPCGRGEWRMAALPDSARLSMKVHLQGDDLMPADYPAFRNFLDGVRMKEGTEITLSRRE
jgi:hypothetical protein